MDTESKNRVMGAFTIALGLGIGGGSIAGIVAVEKVTKTRGMAPEALGHGVVLGIQAVGLGVTQVITGKELVKNPIDLVKPLSLEVIEALKKGEENETLDLEKIKI